MVVYRRSPRIRYLLAVLVLASLTLVTIDARGHGSSALTDLRSKVDDVFSPLQRGTHAALQPIGNFLTGALHYGSLRQENQRLRNEIAAMEAQSIESQAAQAESQQVLSEQRLPFAGGIPTVTVEIIDNGSSNFENTVTIDRGTSSGIAPGQPVIAAGGLVGSVDSVGTDQATVILLTDPTFEVGVRLGNDNIGTAQGVGRTEPLRVTVDTTNAPPKMSPGQSVYTSGMDKFPPGIPVGKVYQFSQDPTSPEPGITLKPLVDVYQLSYLDVMLWSPQ